MAKRRPKKAKESTPSTTRVQARDNAETETISAETAENSRVSISRWELIAVAIVTLVGLRLRMLYWRSLEIEHFDEGVYASDIWFDADNNFQYPDRHLYAPPLLPELIEWMHIFFGATPFAVFGISLFFGCLTVPVIWWVGRRWFGLQAGLVAAILLATGDLHILYSRRALTESMFGFWFLLGVYFGWESLGCMLRDRSSSKQSQLWAIAAGISIGLCWLTKYNGWLPLAVLISGSTAYLIMNRGTLALWKNFGGHLILIAAIAGLFFGSNVWSLQEVGGYASVAANHRQYFVGLSGWWNSLMTQLATLGHFESSLSIAGFCMLPLAFFSLAWKPTRTAKLAGENHRRDVGTSVAIIAGLVLLSFIPTLMVSGILGLIVIVAGTMLFFGVQSLILLLGGQEVDSLKGGTEFRSPQASHASLGFWLLAAWFFGLLVAIPLYTPYPRLVVPFLPAVFLGFGLVVQRFTDFMKASKSGSKNPTSHEVESSPMESNGYFKFVHGSAKFILLMSCLPPLLIITGLIIPRIELAPQSLASGWYPNPFDFGLKTTALRLLEDSLQDKTNVNGRIIYVYGEPAVYYQLNARERSDQTEALIGPVGNLDFAAPGVPKQPVPVFLVVGPHAEKSPLFKEQWEELGDQFELISEHKFRNSDFVLLNDMPAWELRDPENSPKTSQTLRLYQQIVK